VALAEPPAAFPSWFLRSECERCGKTVLINESHAKWRDLRLPDILRQMRHDGCGGRAGNCDAPSVTRRNPLTRRDVTR
jgi:hypothetical protein